MFIVRIRSLSILKHVRFARMTNVQHVSYANKETNIIVDQRKDKGRTRNYNERITYNTSGIISQNQSHVLMDIWPDIINDIRSASQELNFPDVTEWLTRMIEYNVPGGKNTRALILLYAYEMLMPIERMTRENDYLARILAWCIELLQASLLVCDDIEDQSLIRRKKLCWYQHEDVGLAAINDALLIENIIYYLLQKYFKKKDCYIDIMETFHEIMMKTLMGQCLEFTNFCKTLNVDRFTKDLYDGIAYYKTAYYTFILPVKVAMHFVGIKDNKLFEQMTAILLKIGHFYQVQDDYLSCYGNRDIVGKVGTDIEEGKCTWLVVTALQRATPVQRNILKECYGSPDPEKIKRVRQLYRDLDLPTIYFTYEKETYNLLNDYIQWMSCDLPRELFQKILNDLYHRMK